MDMLVKLYRLPDDWSFLAGQRTQGITIRKPLGAEKRLIADWVAERFGDGWASEVDKALCNQPVTGFIAVQDQILIGFACYDATALGYFGPEGVEPQAQGKGTGRALLLACLLDMKAKGYGYAIIGDAGPAEFYAKAAGAVEIPDSTPGIYGGMLERGAPED
jgi:GNAT superfamily N-acetyltransferase